jgi:hypothetical protein
LKFENHGYEYAGTSTSGGYNGFFFKKKTDRPFSKPYPFTRLYPGTGTDRGYRGYTGTGTRRYGPRVHGYGLYPAGFSKPLCPTAISSLSSWRHLTAVTRFFLFLLGLLSFVPISWAVL